MVSTQVYLGGVVLTDLVSVTKDVVAGSDAGPNVVWRLAVSHPDAVGCLPAELARPKASKADRQRRVAKDRAGQWLARFLAK